MSNERRADSVFDAIPPYLIRDDFLGESRATELLHYALSHQNKLASSTVNAGHTDKVIETIRVSMISRDLGEMTSYLATALSGILDDAIRCFNLTKFEVSQTEIELAVHGDGAFYNTHIDTATDKNERSVRVLSAVYYFHAMPKAFTGGNLRLLPLRHQTNREHFLDIEPLNNRLLVFPSWVPHCVMPVVCPSTQFRDSRFAINCWFRKLK